MLHKDRWLLPEGIEELLPAEAARLEDLHRRLLDQFSAWGYELVMPPFIEYLDSLLIGTGNDLDLQTFKLIDQLTGRLMGVRADMTPQVARIDAHLLKREVPTRLCYTGTVLNTRPEGHGGSRSPMQVGAELYGHAGVESDIEVLRLMIATLQAAGVGPLYLDLGHVGIFRELARLAGLSQEQEAQLFDVLQRKAIPEIAELLDAWQLEPAMGTMLGALAELSGGREVLDQAEKVLQGGGEVVMEALNKLRAIASALEDIDGLALNFDLAELRGYHYHTGVVFAAFVAGRGQAVAQGGRYDDIGAAFGRARPATGFSTDLKTLLALSPDAAPQVRGIFAPVSAGDGDDIALQTAIQALRSSGERVIQALPGQHGGAAEMGCDRELQKVGDAWQPVAVKK